MKSWLVITDLTSMQGHRVCLAGYTADCTCVRPVFRRPLGLTEEWLQAERHGIIRPFAVVEFDLQESVPDPPHTEDWLISPVYRVKRVLELEGQMALLERIQDENVASIFDNTIKQDPSCYVAAGEGTRSLGTIQPKHISGVVYTTRDMDKWNYYLAFTDATGQSYRLPVTDLAFRYYLDHLRIREEMTPPEAARLVLAMLKKAQVFIRIGLARHWEAHPDRCYLQITGVHSFPDYLGGRCYADLCPEGVGAKSKADEEEEIPF